VSRRPPHRPPTLLAAALAAALVAAPARADAPPATTSIWGYSGLVVMPTATVHGFRDFSFGLHGLTKSLAPSGLGYATAGVFDGLEAGVVYGVPLAGFTGLSGHAKYQLIRPTRERPTAVAVGLSLIGVNGTERYIDGNNLYLVLSHDVNTTIGGRPFTLLVGHFGFAGNLSFGARMMAGAELPLGDKAAILGDYLGPLGAQGGFFNLGVTFRPVREWQLRAYTMGVPNAPWTDRDYALGVSFTGNMLGNPAGVAEQPGPRPTPTGQRKLAGPGGAPTARPTAAPTARPTPQAFVPATPRPTSVPTPAPVATPAPEAPTPTPSEAATDPDAVAPLHGALLDDKNRPLAGWAVGVAGADRWSTTDLKGRYRLELPLGPYELTVKDPQGQPMLTKPIRLVTAKGMELPLVVALPVGELKGMVIDRQTKQGLGDASIRLFRTGESYNLSNRDSGAFHIGDLQAGEYRVVVTRPRYKPYEGAVSIAARREASVLAALEPKPGSLAGRVTSLRGQGTPGVTVAVPALRLETATDRLGAYQFPELPPGQHQVIFTQGTRRLATTVVRVRSDETATENVTTTPPVEVANRAGTIGGTVTDGTTKKPLAGVKIVVEGKDLTVLTITGSDGRFSVADLPPAKYKLTASRAGYQVRITQATVTAKAGATVTFALTPAR
jgi:hypothetical protein